MGKKLSLLLSMAVLCVLSLLATAVVRYFYNPQSPLHLVALLVTVVAFSISVVLSIRQYWTAIHTAARTARIWVLAPVTALVALSLISNWLATPAGAKAEPLSTPGVVFVVVASTLTVVGLVLTISKLDEIHGRILDYGHLMERCEELVKREKERLDAGQSARIIIFANAPAFGCVSASAEFASYRKQLDSVVTNPRVKVVVGCHSWIPEASGADTKLVEFYKRHWHEHPQLADKINESVNLINMVHDNKRQGNKELFRLRTDIEEVPFHLFLTSERAILFTALSFPYEGLQNTGNTVSRVQSRIRDRMGYRDVQIIAFETGDRAIMQALENGLTNRLELTAVSEDQPAEVYVRICNVPPDDGSSVATAATQGVPGEGVTQNDNAAEIPR